MPSRATPSGQVQSVVRAVRLLRCFEGHSHRSTLTDLARCAELNVSTTFRLLQTLCQTGVLRRAEDSESYELGPAIASLAMTMFERSGFTDANDALHGLVLRTSEAASYGVLDGPEVVVMLRAGAPQPVLNHGRPGTRSPAHATAMGKVLLASGSQSPVAVVSTLGDLRSYTPQTIVDPVELVGELERVRADGFATSDQEQFLGVRAVAAPSYDDAGAVVGAVAIHGESADIVGSRLPTLSALVRETADELSGFGLGRIFGHRDGGPEADRR